MDGRSLLISGLLATILQIGILPAPGFAQVEEEWVRRYDSRVGVGVGVDAAGNVYVAGGSHIFKYKANGHLEWSREYNGHDASDMVLDDAGNVYVTGPVSNVTQDIATAKYDKNGNRLWVKYYAGETDPDIAIEPDDEPIGIGLDANGNVYVVGESGPYFHYYYSEFVTLKYDAVGNELWVAKHRIDESDDNLNSGGGSLSDMAVDIYGNVYLAGSLTSPGDTLKNGDYLTIKYDASGRQRWLKHYDGGNLLEGVHAIAVDAEANVYVTGESGSVTDYDLVTVKYDSTGAILWAHNLNDNATHDAGEDITLDDLGNVYVIGGAKSTDRNYDLLTVKYDSDGKVQWARNYSESGDSFEVAKMVVTDDAGNVYVSAGASGYATIKYDNSGNELWAMRYNGPTFGFTSPSALAIDVGGNVYVTGGDGGIATVKYSQSSLPAPIIFHPTDDANVGSANPTSNVGTSPTLRVRQTTANTQYGYLKFNVSGLTGEVQSAKLRLYVVDASTDGGAVHSVSNYYQDTTAPWTQSELIWNNAPAIAGVPLKYLGPVELNTWVDIDVTSVIINNGVYSFGIKNSSTDEVYYSSKEGANPPELLIRTLDGVPFPIGFTDTFDDGNADSWWPLTPSRWSVGMIPGRTLYTLKYPGTPPDEGRLGEYSVYDGYSAKDFTFECWATSVENVDIETRADIALLYEYLDDLNYSYAVFNKDSASTNISKVVNGVRTKLVTSDGAVKIFQDNDYHVFKVTRSNAEVKVYYDGSLVMSATDPNPVSGKFGVGSFNDRANFDKVSVYEAPVEQLDLIIASVQAPASASAGDSIAITSAIKNQGNAPAGAFRVGIYLSDDNVIDATDRLLDSYAINDLPAGGSAAPTIKVTIPSDVASGSYHLGIFADDLRQIEESDESNNTGSLPFEYKGKALAGKIHPISPPTVSSSLNTEFEVLIEVADVVDLFGLTFELSFDSTYLHAVSETAEPFIGSDVVFLGRLPMTAARSVLPSPGKPGRVE
jgi:hypothetical protein